MTKEEKKEEARRYEKENRNRKYKFLGEKESQVVELEQKPIMPPRAGETRWVGHICWTQWGHSFLVMLLMFGIWNRYKYYTRFVMLHCFTLWDWTHRYR